MQKLSIGLAKWVRTGVWTRVSAVVLVAVIIFSLGVQIGSGRLHVGWLSGVKSENSGLPAQLDYSSVTQVYQSLKENYDGKLTTAQLLDGLKEGLATATNDPYTQYFNADEAKEFSQQLNNSFSGIGAELGKDDQGNIIVISPLKGFPAYNAGLKPQDVIASINGESTSGMSPDAAVHKIRGPKGTKVTLGVVRDASRALSFTIARDDIRLPSVTSKTLSGNIGYIAINSFADDTAGLARTAAAQLKQAGVKGMVLDLRGNPGGLLTAAVDVSSLWLSSGTIVVSEKGTSGDQSYTATGGNVLKGIPTVVLIDNGSASASEIVAGALHDNGVARLIGTKSYGKGVVQQLLQFHDGSELKVTTASWYRPNGQNINKKGIVPDQTVSLSDDDAKAGNDTQLAAAQAYLASH